eukprot:TRINITY_DN289_c0_g1_i5.p1 TRINITY_DN289_c0_g1~~TRINITY_DN289_c0_g1_i5.p1  ORF type:complete len:114 (+),score=12.40 TRINITY_DN289_c0_g1_i5:189-530(+)
MEKATRVILLARQRLLPEARIPLGRATMTGTAKVAQEEKKHFEGKSKRTTWKPDPKTGTWVPEDCFYDNLETAIHGQQARLRNWPRASLDERAWISSLEDLPDRVYKSKCSIS